MNAHSANESVQELYLRVWKSATKAFLNWDAKRVHFWVHQQFDPWFHDPSSLIYNMPALYWLIPLLIPRQLANHFELRGMLDEVICGGKIEEDPTLDWEAASQRVDNILQGYGESLASVRRDLDKRGVGLNDSTRRIEESGGQPQTE